MESKSLILGLAFSVGIFAVKAGAGLSYMLTGQPGRLRRLAGLLTFCAGYGLLFILAGLILTRVALLDHLDALQLFFQSGMTIHFLLAGLLAFWGIVLLKKDPARPTRAWLALVLPCPVCFSVILLATGFLNAFYPDRPAAACLYAGFLLVSFGTAAFLARRGQNGRQPHAGLGRAMLFISGYFLLIIAVAPQFTDLAAISRLAGGNDQGLMPHNLPLLLAVLAFLFAGGFLKAVFKGERSWR